MSERIRDHVRSNVVGYLALFVALGGTTAWAVDGPNPGQNTIGSEDIIGNEVKSDDIGNGRIFNLDIADEVITGAKLKNGTVTGADVDESTLDFFAHSTDVSLNSNNGNLCPLETPTFCGEPDGVGGYDVWHNFGSGTAPAAFFEDRVGVVHLRGLVKSEGGSAGPTIFVLPFFNRPAFTHIFGTICHNGSSMAACRVDVRPDGVVHFEAQTGSVTPSLYLSLEGISFRTF